MTAQPLSASSFEVAAVIEASLTALARNVATARKFPIDDFTCEYVVQLILGVYRGCGCTLIDGGDPRATSNATAAIIRVLEGVAERNLRPAASEPQPSRSFEAEEASCE